MGHVDYTIKPLDHAKVVMKIRVVALLSFLVDGALFAQGVINFANYGEGVNAPITNAAGNLIANSSPYVADLFWSADTNAPFDSLAAAGFDQPFAGSGYFVGGSGFLPDGEIPIKAQVRVWDTTYGSGYYEARQHGGEFGFSNFIQIYPSIPPGQPGCLCGLQSFRLQRLPRLTSTVTGTNTIVFSWPIEQTTYAVQQNTDLSPINWTTLPNTPTTVGENQQVILPVPPANRMFYRLVSQ